MSLENKRELAMAALLGSTSVTEAARQSGISRPTLHRFLVDESFAAEYKQARRKLFEANVDLLTQSFEEIVKTLRRNLKCGNPQAEITAAKVLLDNIFRAVETRDLQLEVEEIKDVIKKTSPSNSAALIRR